MRGPSKESCGRLMIGDTTIQIIGQSKESCDKVVWSQSTTAVKKVKKAPKKSAKR